MRFRFQKNSGMALPTTLLLVAFNVTVLIALFVYANTELRASRNASGSSSSRIMALNGIELAGALIVANSTNNAYVSYQNIVTNAGPRLETKIANVVPIPGAVDPSFQRQVTNPTPLHSGFAAPSQGVDLNYATTADPSSGYILPRTNPPSSSWTNLHENMFQMKWVNVYKGPSSEPTNLIGRFAFWVDDESTKLNINYSGTTNNYNTSSFNNSEPIRTSLYGPRGSKLANQRLGATYDGLLWPLYMELGGVAGISRTNAFQIINRRGNPIWRSDDSASTMFSPYYSLMESRLGTLPPVPGGLAITNISQQSQLGFTATIYSREPELSHASGRPRFDLFNFTTAWANDTSRINEATNQFLLSLNKNYPGFNLKYDLDQFVYSIRAITTPFYSGSNAARTFDYKPPNSSEPNFNARHLPLINETELILTTKSDGTTNISTLQASVELIYMSKTRENPTANVNNLSFDELHMKGSRFESQAVNSYTAEFIFDISIGNNTRTNLVLKPDTNRWFFNARTNIFPMHDKDKVANIPDTNNLKPYDVNLTGMFAVLTGNISFTNTDSVDKISYSTPTTITTKISYGNATNDALKIVYQKISASHNNGGLIITNSLQNTNNSKENVYFWTSSPRADMGVRGDPRLGFHSADLLFSPNGANTLTNVTNPYSTLGGINNDKWKIGEFDGKPLSPDITPPEVFFAQDRGFLYSVFDNHPPDGESFSSSGELGQFPITTFKSGHHLAWSTPRFWGDGRTNMGDNQVYPPDWLMLDCVHTAMFPPNTNRLFTSYTTNSFVSYGRLNINGLKSFFQIPRGSSDRSDTTLDSLLIQARTKDFRDYDESIKNTNGSRDWRRILPSHANRTNLLNYINDEVVRRGSVDNPFLTGFDFTAHLAGNTNSALTNVSDWQFYNPNETDPTKSTTDYRIESLVRSLQQRVTSRGFQFSVFSLGQSVQVVQSGSTYQTNVIGESYFQAVWERAPKHDTNGIISNASSGGAPPLRLLYLRELR